MKKIAVGDLGEFWYADYKEPLVPFEGGYGYVGALVRDDADKPLCHYCGKTFDSLGSHAFMAHGLRARDYKRDTGLLQKSALVSERSRQKSIARAATNTGLIRFQPGRANPRKGLPTGLTGDLNGMHAPELRNRRGTCYDQLMHAARAISTTRGRVTLSDLAKIGIHPVTIRQYFASVEDFFTTVGQESTLHGPAKTDRELLDVLRGLGNHLARTPTKSDLRRFGLPHFATYRRRFGSYAAACRRAGLDPNLPTPDGDDVAITVLTAYATLGSLMRTAAHLHMGLDRVEAIFARYGAPFAVNTGRGGRNSDNRKEWAADMARRLAGTQEQAA